KQFTKDYYDPDKRAIANGVHVVFKDDSELEEVVVAYPIGHKKRRHEGIPLLQKKFITNLARCFLENQQQAILNLFQDQQQLESTAVDEFVELFVARQ
ncbi:MAG: 2-methylcitrate dehydratase, partial [Betaproteobacteria bacterium]|nr:2-methylcitrate dehydratase [Betaproteobacteria bacterium]